MENNLIEGGMHEDMMMTTGTVIWGYDLAVWLMMAAGIFYIICAYFVWRSYKQEKNELIGALLAFLVYQAFNMFFMGLEINTMNMIYSNIAALAVLIGSTYMLKFPFSTFSQSVRRGAFLVSLVVALGVFIWFMQTEGRQMELMNFTLWYDLVVNGIIVGGSIILIGLMSTSKWHRIKALGGGSGVLTCCVVANGAILSGAIVTGSIFGFIAPLLILGSLGLSRLNQPAKI